MRVETLQDLVVDPLEGRADEQAARAGQLLPDALVLQGLEIPGLDRQVEAADVVAHPPQQGSG